MTHTDLYRTDKQKKLYYSISEVAQITGLEQHVIRYWESEFPKLKPRKNRAGNRQFREKDIQIIRYIKHLLHKDMYTVQGAKKKLMESGYKEVEGQMDLLSGSEPVSPPVRAVTPVRTLAPERNGNDTKVQARRTKLLAQVKQELQDIRKLLRS